MAENNAVVRVYDPHAEAKATLKDLERSGFAMNKLSIVGKDYLTEERVIGGYHNAGARMKTWGELANSWGGLRGLLLGSGFYFIPGIGSVIVFGPLVSSIVRALEAAVIPDELSALGAGLHRIGISKHSIVEYEKAVKFDKFIIIAHGAPDDFANTHGVLESPGAPQIVPILRREIRRRG
ncbi:MAG TPA: hypothetical protein VK200_12495 [Candidatus Limnocylindrales bacterium]|nr:hypothetical protein [Candidatus Limnocylindrales bacterium]